MGDLVFQYSENVEFIRVPHRFRANKRARRGGGRGNIPPVVHENRPQNGVLVRPARKPPLLPDDVVREDGVVHAFRIAEGVVAFQLLVPSRVVQKRRGFAGERRGGVELFPGGDAPRRVHDTLGMDELQLHHRRQGPVRRTVGIHVSRIIRPQTRERIVLPRSGERGRHLTGKSLSTPPM